MRTFRPQILLWARLAPSTRTCITHLRKLHLERSLQNSFQEHTGPPYSDKGREKHILPLWEEFYTSSRAIGRKVLTPGDLKRTREEPINLFRDEIFQHIENVEPYKFPKDSDLTLEAACEALNDALRNASIAGVEHDTTEVKQALENLQKVYEASKSNTISIRYIDVEPPSSPYSPLWCPSLGPTLARPWVKELISELQSLGGRILVVGDSGSGEFFVPILQLIPPVYIVI